MDTIEIFNIFIKWLIPFACASGFAYIAKELKENKRMNEAMKESQLSIIRSQLVSKCETYLELKYLPNYARHCLEELLKNYKTLGRKSWNGGIGESMF